MTTEMAPAIPPEITFFVGTAVTCLNWVNVISYVDSKNKGTSESSANCALQRSCPEIGAAWLSACVSFLTRKLSAGPIYGQKKRKSAPRERQPANPPRPRPGSAGEIDPRQPADSEFLLETISGDQIAGTLATLATAKAPRETPGRRGSGRFRSRHDRP